MKIRKLLIMFLTLIFALIITGCGKSEEPLYDESGRSIIKIFMNSGNEFDGIEKDSVWKKIEEEANVSLKITGATHNSDYYLKLNPMINTGKIPDVVFSVPSSSSNAYSNWVDQDLLWNIDDLLAEKPGEYPYIEALFATQQYKNITYGDGAHTMIPLISSNNGWGIYYNAQWLINVGYVNDDGSARVPVTIEEFADVMRLFTTADPNKNGKDDTWGLSPYGSTFYLNPLYHAFGVTPDYDIDANGNASYMYLQPEFKNFLMWFNDMYESGYVNKQFSSNKNNDDRDDFYEGKAGILITNAEQHVTWIANGFTGFNKKGEIVVGPAPVGVEGYYNSCEGVGGFSDWGGWWGGYSISKKCHDPHAALRLFNYIYSPEGIKLSHYGIEGLHYDVVDGEIMPNVDGRIEESDHTFNLINDSDGYSQPLGYYKLGSLLCGNFTWDSELTKITPTLDPSALDIKYQSIIEDAHRYNVLCSSKLTNVTGFYSSYNLKMSKIEDACNIYAINAIMGKSNFTSDYDDLIAKVEGKGYDWSSVQKMILEVAGKAGIIK